MFLPILIAILMGFISPTNTNHNLTGNTVYVTTGDPDPSDPGEGGDEGDGDPGTDPGDDGTGGDTGHVPPPRP